MLAGIALPSTQPSVSDRQEVRIANGRVVAGRQSAAEPPQGDQGQCQGQFTTRISSAALIRTLHEVEERISTSTPPEVREDACLLRARSSHRLKRRG